MPFPRHLTWSAERMGSWMRETVLNRSEGKVWVLAETEVPAGFDSNRLTRVPFWMTSGSGGFTCEVFSEERQIRVEPGDSVLFAAGTYATARLEAPSEHLRVTVEADGLLVGRECVETLTASQLPPQTPAGTLYATWVDWPLSQPASGLLDRLLARIEPQAAAACFRALLWEVQGMLEASPATPREAAGPAELILRYLRDSCDQPINRETVARTFEISPGYMGRLVRQATGRSFQEVLLHERLERARWLLRHSRLSVEEVALGSGFTSANYFSQAFRRVEGVSPREWRRKGLKALRSHD